MICPVQRVQSKDRKQDARKPHDLKHPLFPISKQTFPVLSPDRTFTKSFARFSFPQSPILHDIPPYIIFVRRFLSTLPISVETP